MYSWSHKLFLRLNAMHGRRPWFDMLMVIIAHAMVYPLIGVFLLWMKMRAPSEAGFWLMMSIAVASYAVGYAANYAIAVVYRHRRPVKELPNVRLLVQTLGTWKSFPSDHAMTSAIPATLAFLFGAPWLSVMLFAGFFVICFSRVYVGVHYPRDIIGGLIVGAFSAIVSYSIII